MKLSILSFVLFAALAVVITGCGKTQTDKNMENNLNAEVKALQKNVELSISSFADLHAKLDATLKTHDELAKKYARKMKNHTADDIRSAQKGLDVAKSEVEAAIKSLTPYDQKMDHEQAMSKLKRDEESLTTIKNKVAEAVQAANSAISNHEKMASSLTVKTSGKAKKRAKARA